MGRMARRSTIVKSEKAKGVLPILPAKADKYPPYIKNPNKYVVTVMRKISNSGCCHKIESSGNCIKNVILTMARFISMPF